MKEVYEIKRAKVENNKIYPTLVSPSSLLTLSFSSLIFCFFFLREHTYLLVKSCKNYFIYHSLQFAFVCKHETCFVFESTYQPKMIEVISNEAPECEVIYNSFAGIHALDQRNTKFYYHRTQHTSKA